MLINRSEGRRYSRIYLQVNLLQVKTIKTKEKKKVFIDQPSQNTLAIWNFSEMLSSRRFFFFSVCVSFGLSFNSCFYFQIQENLFDTNNEDEAATVFRCG